MASMQKSREERARSAAQKAADELAASRQRDQDQQQVHHEATTKPASPHGGGGILSSVKEKATATVERAKEYAAETKEGARQALAGDAVARKGETDESAWQQGLDVRRRAAEKAREEAWRVHEPSEEEKGRAATENIFGMAKGEMAGSFAEKMVMPTDVVERKRAEAAASGWHGKAVADATTSEGGPMGEEGTGMPRRR